MLLVLYWLIQGLRLHYGVVFRLPRISKTPIQYGSYTIPPGTRFSMSLYYLHMNPGLFPSPKTFDPSRWLADPVTGTLPTAPNGKPLSRYFAPFSRGTRSCVGMHLAYAQIYICLLHLYAGTIVIACNLLGVWQSMIILLVTWAETSQLYCLKIEYESFSTWRTAL